MTDVPTSAAPPPDESAATSPTLRPVPPPHNAGWAVASVLFFWPLAFSAFNHAFDVYPLWAAGDVAGAQHASDRVRRLGQLSLWIFGGLLLLFVVLYVIVIVVFIAQGDMDFGPHRRYYD
jgi:hypothetical protein